MYNTWARSCLRLPEEPSFLCASPLISLRGLEASFLLVLSKFDHKNRCLYVLNTTHAEPAMCSSIELTDPTLNDISTIAWRKDGKVVFVFRSLLNRIDAFDFVHSQQVFDNQRDKDHFILHPICSISPLSSFSCFAPLDATDSLQLIVGTERGEVYSYSHGPNHTNFLFSCFDHEEPISQLKTNSQWGAALSISGKLAAFSLKESRALFRFENFPKVSTFTLSSASVLAVGLQHSPPRIRLFRISEENAVLFLVALRDLVVFGPSLLEEERLLGGVQELNFLGDNSTLACLLRGRHEPTVFHLDSGRRTTTMTSSSTAIRQSSFLQWSGPNSLFYLDQRLVLCRESFAKVFPSICRTDASRFSLLGADFVSLLSLFRGSPEFNRIDVPEDYIQRYGALKQLAVENESKIAVASNRGFCVYFAQSKRRWKRFQSEYLEESISVQGMAWVPQTFILCVVAVGEDSTFNLRLFDLAEQRLDSAPGFISPPFPKQNDQPVGIDFVGPKVMLLLFTNGIQVFQVDKLSLVPLLFWESTLSSCLRHFCVVPNLKLDNILPRCVLLDELGKCFVVNLEDAQEFLLSEINIADVWTKVDSVLGVLVWTLVDDGLKLWVPSLDPTGEIYRTQQVDIAFAEVGSFPVGSDSDAFICFQAHSPMVRASKSPALHGILGWLLRQNRVSLARRVLAERRFSKSSRLVRAALEDLLQGSLLGENGVSVRKVVNVLGCVPFEMMAAVVARCARQIDPELWPELFSVVGQPRDLFHQCLIRFDMNSTNHPENSELILIAAELLPIVDADRDDPPDGPLTRAKLILMRCQGKLNKEVREYAEKRGLNLVEENQAKPKESVGIVTSLLTTLLQ